MIVSLDGLPTAFIHISNYTQIVRFGLLLVVSGQGFLGLIQQDSTETDRNDQNQDKNYNQLLLEFWTAEYRLNACVDFHGFIYLVKVLLLCIVY